MKALAVCLMAAMPLVAEAGEPLCPEVVLRLVTQQNGSPIEEAPRVEARRCGEGLIQLAAWGRSKKAPELSTDADSVGVVQSFASGDLFVVETAGGSRDRVYVIEFVRDLPVLRHKVTTKGGFRVRQAAREVEVTIWGIWAGDAAERTEVYRFAVKAAR